MKDCFKWFLVVASFGINGYALASELVVDIPKLAGKGHADVAAVLGKPSSCHNGKYGQTCSYGKAATEIVFIQGKADWITVNDMRSVKFSPSAVESLGLKQVKPRFVSNSTIRWEQVEGLLEVSIFPGQSHVDYAYIKVHSR